MATRKHRTRKQRTRKHRTRRSSVGGNGLNPHASPFKSASHSTLRATAPAFVSASVPVSKMNGVMRASRERATNALRPYNGKNLSRRLANSASGRRSQ